MWAATGAAALPRAAADATASDIVGTGTPGFVRWAWYSKARGYPSARVVERRATASSEAPSEDELWAHGSAVAIGRMNTTESFTEKPT